MRDGALMMNNRCFEIIVNSLSIVPASVRYGFLIVFCIGTILLFLLFGPRKALKYSAGFFLIEYLIFLFILTVLAREVQSERTFNFTPFWSYRSLIEGNKYYLPQAILNVITFIPVGVLLGSVYRNIKWYTVLATCASLSIVIETLQFVLKLGFTEFDDLFHNILGGLLGDGVYLVIVRVLDSFIKR